MSQVSDCVLKDNCNKTLCRPKFTHIATVIPSLSISQIKEINKEFEHFLTENNPSVVDKTTRYMRRKDLGLGMLRINHFWKAQETDIFKVYVGRATQS